MSVVLPQREEKECEALEACGSLAVGLKESKKTCLIYHLSLPESRTFPLGACGRGNARGSMCLCLCSKFTSLLEGTVVHVSKRLVWGPYGFQG